MSKKKSTKKNAAAKQEKSQNPKDDKTDLQKVKKKEKKIKDPSHNHESPGQNRALRYLKLWYANKKGEAENWKFEKNRQTWLLQNCYCSKKVPKEDFSTLLKYMKSIQGRIKESTLQEAKDKLEFTTKWESLASEGKLDVDIAVELKKPKLDQVTVKRAKKIVKKLDPKEETSED